MKKTKNNLKQKDSREQKKDLLLCKILQVTKGEEDELIHTVVTVDLGYVKDNGKCEVLTGSFAGCELPLISDRIGKFKEDDVYSWAVAVEFIKNIVHSNDVEVIKNIVKELNIGRQYYSLPNEKALHLIENADDYEYNQYYDDNYDDNFVKNDEVPSLKELKKEVPEEPELKDLASVIDDIKKCVISQDEAVTKIATAVYSNQQCVNQDDFSEEEKMQMKKNVLLVGPTGVGKTEIIRQLSNKLHIPFISVNANDYTISGYKGKDVDSMLLDLLDEAGNDYEKAKKGIIFIDEVDKLAANKNDVSTIATDGVQKSLLKLIEGTKTYVEYENDYLENKKVYFDTSNITFIFAGAFSDLFVNKEKVNHALGFNSKDEVKSKKITTDDLIEYGLIPEFVGRIPVIVNMNDLREEDYKKIIVDSKISYLKILKKYYKKNGVTLNYDDYFVNKIAKKAVLKKCGARGIKTTILEELEDLETDILTNNIKEVNLTENGIVRVRKTKEI